MTQEEKQLLLKDLCARLPYGVALCAFYKTDEGWKEGNTCFLGMRVDEGYIELYLDNGWIAYLDDVKPYLRPMSSMTEEEENEWRDLCVDPLFDNACNKHSREEQLFLYAKAQFSPLDWLIAHHFDYRGLIEKGLALEASEGMYKTE